MQNPESEFLIGNIEKDKKKLPLIKHMYVCKDIQCQFATEGQINIAVNHNPL